MLVLTRKVGEKIHVGSEVVITVVRIQNDKVRIGIEAPSTSSSSAEVPRPHDPKCTGRPAHRR